MSAPSKHQRTEPASERRIRKARRKGQVPRSKEVSSAITLAAGLIWAALAGRHLVTGLSDLIRTATASGPTAGHPDLLYALSGAVVTSAQLLAFPLLTLGIAGGMASVMQTGFVVSHEALKPQLNRLNPTQGIKKIFSARQLTEAARVLMRFLLFTGVAYLAVRPEMDRLAGMAGQTPVGLGGALAGLIGRVLVKVLLVSVVLAIIDYALARHRWKKDLKMTKQEVKDERKDLEGDPEIKGRIRRLMYGAMRRRMLAAVKDAHVVVTNPTHVAVALRYDPGQDGAPRVLAKGRGFVAGRIREKAAEHGVPLLSDPPLARALYRLVEVGTEVPEVLFRALAEVFAYVFHRDRETPPRYRPVPLDLDDAAKPFEEGDA